MSTEKPTLEGFVTAELVKVPGMGEVEGADYKARHDEKIAAITQAVDALPDIADAKTLQVNQDLLTELTRTRTGVDKFRKAMFEPFKRLKDQVDVYLGTNADGGLQRRIKAQEERIEAKKKAYTDKLEEVRREAERIMEARTKDRTAKLKEWGMTFDGQAFSFKEGDQNFAATFAQVQMASDEQFAGVLAKLETLNAIRRERIAAEEQAARNRAKADQDERDRIARQKVEQEEERKKLDAERAQMVLDRAELRGTELVILGAKAHGYGPAAMRYEIGDVVIGHMELGAMDGGKWAEARDAVRDAKAKAALPAPKPVEPEPLVIPMAPPGMKMEVPPMNEPVPAQPSDMYDLALIMDEANSLRDSMQRYISASKSVETKRMVIVMEEAIGREVCDVLHDLLSVSA